QINRLRRKIEDDPANPGWRQTGRGSGYRLSID
ncbi:DNA-binding response regulator, partial [Rhizobium leguminosarum]